MKMWSLFLVFLVLKLASVIAWSWWWVTAPLWIPALLLMIVVAILRFCEEDIVAAVEETLDEIWKGKKK